MLGRGSNLGGLRHSSDARFAGFRHLAGVGADRDNTVAPELHDVAAGRGIVPHQRIHRRRQQNRSVGGEQDRAGKIVRVAVRHLRHQVGGRGRHHDQVAVARKANVPRIELTLGIEQVRVDALMRQRACRERGDELLRGFGQHAANLDMPLFQAADQVQRLVGGNAAADDQGDARQARSGLAGGLRTRDRGLPGGS